VGGRASLTNPFGSLARRDAIAGLLRENKFSDLSTAVEGISRSVDQTARRLIKAIIEDWSLNFGEHRTGLLTDLEWQAVSEAVESGDIDTQELLATLAADAAGYT
jgi:hypothetical protein